MTPSCRRRGHICAGALLGAIMLLVMSVAAGADAGDSAAARDGGTVAPLDDPLFDLDDELEAEPAGFPDPLERVNRGTLRVNRVIDRWLIEPVADTYRFFVPDPARRAVRRVLANLNAPAILVNDLLQREWRDGSVTATRFALNTTVGLAGIFDPATDLGYPRHDSDFGQTLALQGVWSGPFLMLPILGPTTMRDGVGSLVDIMFRPTTYLLGPTDQLFYTTVHGGSSGLALRDANAEELEALEESSIDYYAALRNAYYQHRTAAIWSRREHRRSDEAGSGDDAP